ncbi:MAG: hypothetical protein AABZ06_04880 [Bdellovibrionota bacterium]
MEKLLCVFLRNAASDIIGSQVMGSLWRRYSSTLAALLLACASSYAGTVYDIELYSSSGQPTADVKVGDKIELRIVGDEALMAGGSTISGKEDLQDNGWEIISGIDSRLVFSVTPLKSGQLTLPSLFIKGADGNTIGETGPFAISVNSAIKADDKNPQQPEDASPPVGLPYPWLVVVSGITILLIIIGAGIYAFLKWRKSRMAKSTVACIPAEPPKSEDEIALAALDALEKMGYIQKGKFKPHYFRLSEIIKTYLGARYDFDAVESTSWEILFYFRNKKHDMPGQVIDELRGFFESLDLVKFTDHIPHNEAATGAMIAARNLVINSRRIRQAQMNIAASGGVHAP